MGLGIRETPVAMPDTYGLPIYSVSKVIKQRVGDEVHMLCGTEAFGQITWLYIAKMKISDLMREASETVDVAFDVPTEMIRRAC